MSKPSAASPRRIAPSILFCWVLRNSKKMCHSNLYSFISPSFFLRPRLRPFTPETGMLHSTFPFTIYFHSSAFLFLLHFKPENSATTEIRKELLFSENSHFEITTSRNRKKKAPRITQFSSQLSDCVHRQKRVLRGSTESPHAGRNWKEERTCFSVVRRVSEWVWRERKEKEISNVNKTCRGTTGFDVIK